MSSFGRQKARSPSGVAGLFLWAAFVSLLHSGCATKTVFPGAAPGTSTLELVVTEESPADVADGLGARGLADALFAQERVLLSLPKDASLRLGAERFSVATYRSFVQNLRRVVLEQPDQIEHWLREHARSMRVGAQDSQGGSFSDLLVTGYYEPVLPGSRSKTARYSQPLYETPADLLSVELGAFREKLKSETPLRGRLVGRKVVPYYTRAQIEGDLPLSGQNLELCWVDPVDAFFLQIQGSGTVQFSDGTELVVGFAERNGQPYSAIGKFLTDVIPLPEMTTQKIVAHLRTLPQADAAALMNRNASYVFFQPSSVHARTFSGAPATAGRTIATDKSIFSKGLIGFLDFPDQALPGRYVVDQDIGGAITGPRRVDLFTGRGTSAGEEAGSLKARGVLYYLVPR